MAYAIEYEEFGDPEVLQYREIPDPQPGPGEVVVSIRAAGVNPIDWKLRRGIRPSDKITAPRRLGSDAAGVIVALGEGVTGWRAGDEVVVSGARGAYASAIPTPVSTLTPKPSGVTFEQGAALGVPVGTAHQVVASIGVKKGETLLIHGGAGAVGQAAIQFARRKGVVVIATASERNHARIVELGAIPVTYGDGLIDRVRSVAINGVHAALDLVGSDEAIVSSLELVAERSRIGTIVQGAKAPEYGILAWSGGSSLPLTAEQNTIRADAVPLAALLIAQGVFRVEIADTLALTDAAEAHRRSETGHVQGKLILRP